jgi:hypothetical protein
MFFTLDVLKIDVDIDIDFNDEHSLKTSAMFSTIEVLKLFKFRLVNELQFLNIALISFKYVVSKWTISNELREEQL